MSFSKAKRFNALEDCVPPVGSYDPKINNNSLMVPTFTKPDKPRCPSDGTVSPTSSVNSCSSLDRRTFVTPRAWRQGAGYGSQRESSMKIRELELEIRRLLSERANLLKNLSSKEDEARKLDFKLQGAIKEKLSLQSSMAHFNKEMMDISRRNEILKIKLDTLESGPRKKDPAMELANLKAAIAGKDHEIKDLRKEVSEVRSVQEQLVMDLGEKNDDIKNGSCELDSAIQMLQGELDRARQQITDLQETNVVLQSNKDDIMEKMIMLEDKHSQMSESAVQLNQHREKLLEDLLECRRQLELKEETSANTIDVLRSENLSLLVRVEEQTNQRRMQEKLLACELDNAYQKLATSEDCSKTLQEYRDSLVHRLSIMKDSLEELEKQQMTDMATIRQLKTEIKDLSSQLSQKERESLDSDRKITVLNEQISVLLENDELIRDLQCECRRLGHELGRCESDSKNLIDKLEGKLLITELTLQSSQKGEDTLQIMVDDFRAQLDGCRTKELELQDDLGRSSARQLELKSELDCVNEVLACQNGRCQEYEDVAKVTVEEILQLKATLEVQDKEIDELRSLLTVKVEVAEKLEQALLVKVGEVERLEAAIGSRICEFERLQVSSCETMAELESSLAAQKEVTAELRMNIYIKDSEVERLQSESVAKEAEIASHLEEIELLHTEMGVRDVRVERLESTSASLDAELARVAVVLEGQTRLVAEKCVEIGVLFGQLSMKEASMDELLVEILLKNTKLDELGTQLEEISAEVTSTNVTVKLLGETNKEKEQQLEGMRAEVANKDLQIGELLEHILQKETVLSNLGQELTEKTAHLETLSASVNGVVEQLVETNAEKDKHLDELRAELATKNLGITELLENVFQKESRFSRVMSEKDVQLENLAAEIAKMNDTLLSHRSDNAEKDSKLHELAVEMTTKDKKIEELFENVLLKESSLISLCKQMSEKDAELNKLSIEVVKITRLLANCEEVNKQKDSELDGLRSETTTRALHFDKLLESLAKNESTLDDLRQALAEKDAKLLEMEVVLRRNEELTGSVETQAAMTADLADAREHLESLLLNGEQQQALIDELEAENNCTASRNRQLETQLHKLEANVQWSADRERELTAELNLAEARAEDLAHNLHATETELNGHRRTKEAEGRENEQLLQALTNEYEAKMMARSDELATLQSDITHWKSLYEQLQAKVEPFREQIDAFEQERQVLMGRTLEATSDLEKLGQNYAKLLGHQNHKQKIHYVAKLKDDFLAVKDENIKLRSEVLKYRSAMRKQTSSAQRFDAARAFYHDKENGGTPLQPRKLTLN